MRTHNEGNSQRTPGQSTGTPAPSPTKAPLPTRRDLFEFDAHLVLCGGHRDAKVAIQHKWHKSPATVEEWDKLAKAHGSDAHVGIVPGGSGLAVLDVDDGDPAELIRKHPPLARSITPSTGSHLIYAHPGGRIGNSKWSMCGCAGDMRADAGYVVVWDPDAWWRALRAAKAGSHLDHPLPSVPKPAKAKPKPEPAKRKSPGPAAGRVTEHARRLGLTFDRGQWEGPCPACETGDDRLRLMLDGTIWCRICTPDGDPVAFANLCEAAGLPMPGARGDEPKPAFDDYNGAALAEALDMLGVDVRFDIRALREQYRRGDGPWRHLTDNHVSKLRDELATNFDIRLARSVAPFRFSGEKWRVAYGATLARCEVDPFLEWLHSLEEWDGTERIELLLHDMFGAGKTPLVRWVSRYLFCGAVHRAFEPGAKLDVMPVLIGRQGIGKSHVLAAVLPAEHRGRWFNDSLNLRADAKVLAEALQGRVIVEASELAGLYRAEIEALKAFLTRQDDGGVRLAHRRNPNPMPRRAIIFGTTNDDQCLPNDPSGLRRFAPVPLDHGCDVLAHLQPVRDQLWAEALAWWRQGGQSAALPRTLIPAAAAVAERHRSVDEVFEEKIKNLEFLEHPSLEEIMRKLGAGHRETKRVTGALRNVGWKPGRSKERRFWTDPRVTGDGE